MRILERVAVPITADPNGIAAAQTLGGAAAVALNGVSVKANDGTAAYDIGRAVLDPPRRVVITSSGDDTGVDFTIVGTDRMGHRITEVLAGANAGAATSLNVFKTIISITSDGATDGDIEVGWGTEFITPWILLGQMRGHYHWLSRVFIGAGGTVNYDLEVASGNVMDLHGDRADDVKAVLSAQTGNVDSQNDAPYTAVRLRVNSADVNVTLRVIPSRSS